MISSKVAACTCQPVACNGHQRTCGHLTGLQNKPQQKQTGQLLEVVFWLLISLFMELLIGDENRSLSLCAYVASFNKSVHISLSSNSFLVNTNKCGMAHLN